jgi:DNA-binding beta-propeller fold protein YncE
VVAVAGFTARAAYAGDADHLRAPRGIAVKPTGGLYVANGGGAGVAASVSFHHAGTSQLFSPGTYFALTAPQDLAWDAAGGRLLASAGRRLVAMGADGVQTAVAESDWTLNGLAWDGTTLLAAEASNRQVLSGLPATLAALPGVNLALGNAARPWGVVATSAGGVQVVYVGQPNTADATVVRFTAGTTVAIATDSILSGVRDLVLTPCPTPKLLAAARSTGTVAVLDAGCTTTGCAGGPALRSLIQGLGNPVGLAFEGSGDTATLWVSDESLNTVFQVTGPFCSL